MSFYAVSYEMSNKLHEVSSKSGRPSADSGKFTFFPRVGTAPSHAFYEAAFDSGALALATTSAGNPQRAILTPMSDVLIPAIGFSPDMGIRYHALAKA
jgi:hypothetical protein